MKTIISESLSSEQRSKFFVMEKRIDEAIKQGELGRIIKISISSTLEEAVVDEVIRVYLSAGWKIEKKFFSQDYRTWLQLS